MSDASTRSSSRNSMRSAGRRSGGPAGRGRVVALDGDLYLHHTQWTRIADDTDEFLAG
ncbi:hypothetical protein [Frigoribacterium sp. PhB24]|uniref:hypothetical protein n=1 Tax=Frigoribacterium sp. PhB24 TaxID=2485204 RepID=UPI000FA4261E|nr:hypothetical protein [Frigoribacterium sp. PhB24]ROS48367.1 hypothetical protein EDF50_2859 [Frigoribacterium sp. PhB24]